MGDNLNSLDLCSDFTGIVSRRAGLDGRANVVFESRLTLTQGYALTEALCFFTSCLKMFLIFNVWCSLRLLQLKTEGQTI